VKCDWVDVEASPRSLGSHQKPFEKDEARHGAGREADLGIGPSEESTIFVDRAEASIVLEENLGLQGKICKCSKTSIRSDLPLQDLGQDQ